MAAVYLESLDLQGFSTEIRIMNYKLENRPGQHPIATITAECSEQMDWSSFSKDVPTQEIRLMERHHDSILFSGNIDEVSLIENGLDYYCYEIVLVGLSDVLDQKKKCRSFQNVSMTYQDIISFIANENYCSVKFQLTKDTAIHIPVIQYEETDCQFIKRMASNVQAEVLVNETARGLELIIKNEFTNVVDQYLKKRYAMGFSKLKGLDNKLNKKKLANKIDDTLELANLDKRQSKLISDKMDDLAAQTEKLKTQQAVIKELNNLKKAAISNGDKKGAGLIKSKLKNMKQNVAKTTNQINSINTSIAQRSQNIVNAKKLAEGVFDYSIDNKWVLNKAILKALPGTVAYHIPKDVTKKAMNKVEKDIAKKSIDSITEGINNNSGNQKTIDVNAVADQVF